MFFGVLWSRELSFHSFAPGVTKPETSFLHITGTHRGNEREILFLFRNNCGKYVFMALMLASPCWRNSFRILTHLCFNLRIPCFTVLWATAFFCNRFVAGVGRVLAPFSSCFHVMSVLFLIIFLKFVVYLFW